RHHPHRLLTARRAPATDRYRPADHGKDRRAAAPLLLTVLMSGGSLLVRAACRLGAALAGPGLAPPPPRRRAAGAAGAAAAGRRGPAAGRPGCWLLALPWQPSDQADEGLHRGVVGGPAAADAEVVDRSRQHLHP